MSARLWPRAGTSLDTVTQQAPNRPTSERETQPGRLLVRAAIRESRVAHHQQVLTASPYCCTYRCARRPQIQPISIPGAHCLWIPASPVVQQTSLAYHPNSARTRTTASIPSYCITRSYGTLAGLHTGPAITLLLYPCTRFAGSVSGRCASCRIDASTPIRQTRSVGSRGRYGRS